MENSASMSCDLYGHRNKIWKVMHLWVVIYMDTEIGVQTSMRGSSPGTFVWNGSADESLEVSH